MSEKTGVVHCKITQIKKNLSLEFGEHQLALQ